MGNNVLKDKFCFKNVKKDIDVLFLGSVYGKRVEFINFLQNKFRNKNKITFKVAGGFIDSTINSDYGGDNYGASANWLEIDNYIDLIQRSKICLSLDKTEPSHIPAIKGKIFEYLSCGSLCMTDINRELKYMIPENCIEYFNSFEECFIKINENLNDDKYKIKANYGHEWYLANFDSKKFWKNNFEAILKKKNFNHAKFLNSHYKINKRFESNINKNELIDFSIEM